MFTKFIEDNYSLRKRKILVFGRYTRPLKALCELLNAREIVRRVQNGEFWDIHETVVKKICEVKLPDPEHGDLKLSVMPFENNGEWVSLPEGFKIWEHSFNDILKMIPLQDGANTHYVTIDSKFFTTDEFLRREGVHVDGNFCVDPNFRTINEYKESWGGASPKPTWGGATYKEFDVEDENGSMGKVSKRIDYEDENGSIELKSSWGGASPKPTWGGAMYDGGIEFKTSWGGAGPKPTWGGAKFEHYEAKEDNSHVKMDWVLPYKIMIPIGDYISEKKGGILTVSTEVGCQAWSGKFKGEILSEGAFTKMEDQLTDDKKIVFEKNSLYFMSSNTPHETLLITKGKRRTFMRITLNHNYLNKNIKGT